MVDKNEESFLDLGTNLDDVPELSTVPAGEYELCIEDLRITTSEKGRFLIARFSLEGMENMKTISNPFRLPEADMALKDQQRCLRGLKHFYSAFDIPGDSTMVFAEQVGKRGYAMLGEEEDAKYGKQNRINSFSLKK